MIEKKKNKCLTDKEIALFIDLKKDFKGYNRVTRHISSCDDCLDKIIDIKKMLISDEIVSPHELSERAFRKSSLEIGKSMFWKSSQIKKTIGSLAIAASVFIIVIMGINNNDFYEFKTDPYTINSEQRNSSFSTLTKKNNSKRTVSNNNSKYKLSPKKDRAITREKIYRSAIQKEEEIGNPLVFAGYIFFLMSNSESVDKELFDKFNIAISDSRLDLDTINYLIKQKWYYLIMKEVSKLPEQERDDFSEGYILSLLYHSDNSGKVNGATIEWGVKLALNASMDEIRQCMLYQR